VKATKFSAYKLLKVIAVATILSYQSQYQRIYPFITSLGGVLICRDIIFRIEKTFYCFPVVHEKFASIK
jgi:hypothetical protein